MAPSTPPPPSNVVLAAFTIASTASFVMSPRSRVSRASAILRFMDQADAASIFVERSRCFHRTRIAVERKRFRFRMDFAPFGEHSAHSALAGNVKLGGEFAHVVKNEQAARRDRAIPEIKLGERGLVFVGTVENDELGIAVEIFSGGHDRSVIEGTAFRDLDKILQSGADDPAP